MKFRLEMTSVACPEQYDVFYGDEQVGYLRLRHGVFRCYFPNSDGEMICEAYPKGDGLFEYDEREPYIKWALEHIRRKMTENIEYEIEEME